MVEECYESANDPYSRPRDREDTLWVESLRVAQLWLCSSGTLWDIR